MTVKISALPAAAALAGTEVLPIVQAGETVKATAQAIANLAASGLVVGTTPITNGTATRLLYETAGNLLGEITGATSDGTALTLVAPVLGTPASGTLTNCTGLPAAGVVGTAAILGANTFTALQTITQASANAGILASTGYSLTGSNATSMIDLAGTWNTSGNPVALKIAMTNTASGATSKFVSFLAGAAGATEVFSVDKAGNVVAAGNLSCGGAVEGYLQLYSSTAQRRIFFAPNSNGLYLSVYGWVNFTASADAGTSVDTNLSRISAGLLGVGTGAGASFAGSLKLTDLFTNNAAALIKTNTTLTDFAAAGGGTLLNAPTAGNPTKWIAIVDNGTTRYIPTWSA